MSVTKTSCFRTCPLCEAVCGLELTVQDGRVLKIQGDEQDVFSRGFICPKGASLAGLHDDPDRLRRPLIRRGDDPATAVYEEVSWDEAFAEVERRLAPILKGPTRDALAIYLGNPNVHNLAGLLYGKPLIKALGTRNVFSASTVDQMPKHVSSGFMFGDPAAIAVPDLDRTDFLLMLGANPLESNGSLCTAPDFPGRLKALKARGGRLVVVDPRRTRTAERADEHVSIRPGTDAHLLLAMLHVLFEESLVRLGALRDQVSGLDELASLVQPFAPERVSELTAVPAATIRRLARELAAQERAVVYGRIGTHTVAFGTLAAWAVDVLNAVTGHLDTEGGAMWPHPAHARAPGSGKGRGFVTGRYRSRVSGHPEVRSELPCSALAEEIDTPGAGQVRALITVAGNPVLSTPDSARLERALGTLECMISVDPYRNETTRHAHVILPPPSPLEKSHYDIAFYELSVRNVAKWSPPVFEAEGPSEADILARLALICAGQGAQASPAAVHQRVERTALEMAKKGAEQLAERSVEALQAELKATEPVDRVVEIMVRSGSRGDQFGAAPGGLTFEQLRSAPHGLDLGPLEPALPGRLRTPSGKVELAPPQIVTEVARLERSLAQPVPEGLLLIGRRDLRSNNSWMHNLHALVKGPDRCQLQMHPDDAQARGMQDGQWVSVKSETGEVSVQLELTDSVMKGVVSLPHGWGHGLAGTQLDTAAAHAGVNTNLLSGGPLDPLSGNAVLNGIPVAVRSDP